MIKNQVKIIKLRDLLMKRNEKDFLREFIAQFPPINIGSITLVDQIVLLTLLELVNPESILEIGTYQGYTTRLFVKNCSAKFIYSIDLPKTNNKLENIEIQRTLVDGNYNDSYLADLQNTTGEIYLENLTMVDAERIFLIKSDSTVFNYSEISDVQFAFIDGGHSYEIVKSDTENVRKKLNKGVIVWHDYASEIHSDVTTYLNNLAGEKEIFHVSGSLCAFEFVNINL